MQVKVHTIEFEYAMSRTHATRLINWQRGNLGAALELIDPLDSGGFVLRLSLAASNVEEALTAAFMLLRERHAEAPTSIRTIVPRAVRATPSGETDHLAALVGVHEIAVLFGISKQAATQMTKRSGFPRPVQRLAMGPVFVRRAVLRYRRSLQRRRR